MSNETNTIITIPDSVTMQAIVGISDEVLRTVQESFSARITIRGNRIHVLGDPVEVSSIASVFADLIKFAESGDCLTSEHARRAIDLVRFGQFAPGALRDDVLLTYRGRAIRPKTTGQKRYADSIRANTITFGIGPAGTARKLIGSSSHGPLWRRGRAWAFFLERSMRRSIRTFDRYMMRCSI